jgi:hypothetical protein
VSEKAEAGRARRKRKLWMSCRVDKHLLSRRMGRVKTRLIAVLRRVKIFSQIFLYYY